MRVNLAVVSLGSPARLGRCLDALREHETRHDFTVSAVLNADGVERPTTPMTVEDGVAVDRVPFNAGWSGGLHRARALTDAELLVWVQDDMLPEPGWLDALVDAAERHPEVGGFGSVRVDAAGVPTPPNAGSATPYDEVGRWNQDDRSTGWRGVTTHDWVTSTGFLTRARAWDDLGGTDPRFWPVNHGDKDYCTHLRSHGWDVALVADARVRHEGAASSPTAFRLFVSHWREPWFNARWSAVVAELAGRSSAPVGHPCRDWASGAPSPLEAVVGSEASRMVIPLSRMLAEEARVTAASHEAHAGNLLDQLEQHREALRAAVERIEEMGQQEARLRRRVRRQRRRLRLHLAAQPADAPPVQPAVRGWTRWLRRAP